MTWLTVVGSLNADLTLLVDHLPTAGETVVATSPALVSSGGKGGNQAAAAAAFGAAVTMVGKVGDDQQGRQLFADLAARGVDGSAVIVASGARTGGATIAVDAMAKISSCSIRAPTACSAPMKSKPQDSPPPRQ